MEPRLTTDIHHHHPSNPSSPQYLANNDLPVVGLAEGYILNVAGPRVELIGAFLIDITWYTEHLHVT